MLHSWVLNVMSKKRKNKKDRQVWQDIGMLLKNLFQDVKAKVQKKGV